MSKGRTLCCGQPVFVLIRLQGDVLFVAFTVWMLPEEEGLRQELCKTACKIAAAVPGGWNGAKVLGASRGACGGDIPAALSVPAGKSSSERLLWSARTQQLAPRFPVPIEVLMSCGSLCSVSQVPVSIEKKVLLIPQGGKPDSLPCI